VTVLADTAIRADDLDESGAEEAKRHAEEMIANQGADFDHKAASIQLEEALAQLRLIRQLRG
jgi:F-type H+-transporting ATPase subunit epsilon